MNKNIVRLSSSLQRLTYKPSTPTIRSLTTSTEDEKKPVKMDQIKSNPYFDKYQAKLKAVYDEDPERFLEKLQSHKVEKIGNPEDYGIDLGNGSKSKMSKSMTKKRTLDTIMKLDMVKDLQREAIKAIWITFISELNKFPGMINDEEYEKLAKRSSAFTTFLFPLPREQGYEFILAQWAGHECHFTPLINYQAHGADAPTIMTIVYFDELLESKKTVLEMTEIDTSHLKPEQAQFLIHLMKEYYIYSKDGDEKHTILSGFTNEPHKFDHMSVVNVLKEEGLSVADFADVKDIEEVTKGILERVSAKVTAREKPAFVREDKFKEKDLADFS